VCKQSKLKKQNRGNEWLKTGHKKFDDWIKKLNSLIFLFGKWDKNINDDLFKKFYKYA